MKNSASLLRSLIATICLLASCPALSADNAPGPQWDRMDDPASHGWNAEALEGLEKYLVEDTHITGLMIVQEGKVVYAYGDIRENSYIASIRKSVLAMLYGRYVQNGTIDLQETIQELGIDDVEGILPIEQAATVQDIISARSGVYHPEGYAGGMQEFAPERGSVESGSYWLYSNWDFNVAGYIFELETNQNIYDEVERQLAIPLQMEDWDRSLQRKEGDVTRSRYLAYPMNFSTRDMARIGQLMLNRGDWNGTQLISEAWIDEMLAQRTTSEELNANVPVFKDTDIRYGYGYMWWLWEREEDPRFQNAYSAHGHLGQTITVYPAIDTVLAYKTKEHYGRENSTEVREALLRKAIEPYQPR